MILPPVSGLTGRSMEQVDSAAKAPRPLLVSDDKKTSSKKSGGGDAVAPAPPKTTKKDPVKSVQKEQKKTKDFLKEDNKKIAKENPGLAQKNLQVKNKKLGEEYERLRGDKSPQATARRKKNYGRRE